MKYVVFLGDGMADRPVPQLDGRTPLEAASHPNMDRLASDGLYGLARTVPFGMKPGSDVANLSVMGFDPEIYYTGRSPLEAASIGIDFTEEDVTYRCNFVTLSDPENFDAATMDDYCAGEITSEEAAQLVEVINEKFGTDTVHLYPGVSYRQCLVLRNAETGVETTQPHDIPGQLVGDKLPTGTNSELMREIMAYAGKTFPKHPVNLARVAAGKHPANMTWFWGEGRKPALKPYEELYGVKGAVISAVDLIQGIGKCADMRVIKVEGATGNYHTDFAAKGRAAIEALETGCDYVYIHVEAADECGHQYQIKEKVWSIEQIDEKVVAPVMEYLRNCGEDYAVLLMPDHPTPLDIRTHTADPVPFVLYRSTDVHREETIRYTEKNATDTGVFVEQAYRLTDMLLGKTEELEKK